MGLAGKVALVTGSTSGIGVGIARALAAAGADVMLNGFGDAAQIEALRAGMAKQYGVKVGYSGADISKPDAIAGMVAQAQKELGSVDILVNNAGIQFTAPVEEFPDERWDAIIAINLSGVFHGMQAAIPGMKQKGWGRIINIASAHGLVGSEQKVAYVAAKHGVARHDQGRRRSSWPTMASPSTRSAPAGCSPRWCEKQLRGPRRSRTARRSSRRRMTSSPRSSRWCSSPPPSRSAAWRCSCVRMRPTRSPGRRSRSMAAGWRTERLQASTGRGLTGARNCSALARAQLRANG